MFFVGKYEIHGYFGSYTLKNNESHGGSVQTSTHKVFGRLSIGSMYMVYLPLFTYV